MSAGSHCPFLSLINHTDMDEIKIKELISRGENETLEFKEAGHDSLPSSLFDTICAFLNTEGGIILLGVNDDGEISGVNPDFVTKLKTDLANLANNPQKNIFRSIPREGRLFLLRTPCLLR